MDRPLSDKRPIGPFISSSNNSQQYKEIGESQFDELTDDQERVKQLTLEAHQQMSALSEMSMQDLWKDKENTLLDLLFNSAVYGECNTLVAIPRQLLPSLAGNVEVYAQAVPGVNDSVRVAENSGQATFPLSHYVEALAMETGCEQVYNEQVLDRLPLPSNNRTVSFDSLDEWREYYDGFSMNEINY